MSVGGESHIRWRYLRHHSGEQSHQPQGSPASQGCRNHHLHGPRWRVPTGGVDITLLAHARLIYFHRARGYCLPERIGESDRAAKGVVLLIFARLLSFHSPFHSCLPCLPASLDGWSVSLLATIVSRAFAGVRHQEVWSSPG